MTITYVYCNVLVLSTTAKSRNVRTLKQTYEDTVPSTTFKVLSTLLGNYESLYVEVCDAGFFINVCCVIIRN